MKTLPRLLVLAALLPAAASAVIVDFTFRYDRVELKNGRRLEDVVLSQYDTLSGRVVAVTGAKKAMTVSLADLPDAIATRIRERAPVQTEAEIQAEREAAAEDRKEAKRRALELEKRALEEARANREAQRLLDVKLAEIAADRDAQQEEIAAAAQALAEYYFTYEADPHSSAGYVFSRQVMLDDPEPVPGWSHRWRIKGRVGLQYLTRNAGATGRNAKEFELLIDAPPKTRPKLVDVTISRM